MVNIPEFVEPLMDLLYFIDRLTPSESTTLLDLEIQVFILIELYNNFIGALAGSPPPDSQAVMDQCRSILNFEFKMLCEKCATPHYQDEISAPER